MEKQKGTHRLVQLALLVAVELVMTYTPLGYLHVGPLSITFLMVPVVLGSILAGPSAGALLGGRVRSYQLCPVFWRRGLWRCSDGHQPLRTFLVCVPTRILAGWLPGVIFQAVYKAEGARRHWLSFAAASLAGPVLNTVFFMSALVACFYGTEYIQGLAQSMGAGKPLCICSAFCGHTGCCRGCCRLSGLHSHFQRCLGTAAPKPLTYTEQAFFERNFLANHFICAMIMDVRRRASIFIFRFTAKSRSICSSARPNWQPALCLHVKNCPALRPSEGVLNLRP